MQAWRTHAYGDPLTALRLDEVPVPEPGPGEVRVRVQAAPLNLNDLERVTGGNMAVRPELPYSPGMEVMGVVDACGPGTESWAGQRVVAMTRQAYGGFAEQALCNAAATFAMPDDVALPGAAALLFPFHLAWLGLVERAELQAGETVLVHAAAGGSGSAAVQLAQDLGARVIATAGSPEKLALCRDLGADVAVGYDDYVAATLEATGGRGVDVVFDNVGAAVVDGSLSCLVQNGRYVSMGFASDKTVADEPFWVPRKIMSANMRLCGVLLAYAEADVAGFVKQAMGIAMLPPELGRRITAEVVDRVRAGRVRPVVGEVVGFGDVPVALDALARRRTVGRTVVLLD